ncbi:Surfeit locus 1 family protein [Nostoc sp. 3335mG]|nr:Surfeit locus 1 family protein [Nostoc sp. 3335mG]
MAMAGAAMLLVALFVALGVWQVQRRAWKHDLIAAVETRVHAAPVPAPGPDRWAAITAATDAYRRVEATGRLLYDRTVLVRAVSDLGAGYWVMTPLASGDGTAILINRGFVSQTDRNRLAPGPAGPVRITGLLRISEPEGGFLRSNDPAKGNWYSRDVAAIARAQRLDKAAPYFIDADRAMNAPGQPVGGLTVVRFSDNHLIYALTWFGMALLSAWGAWWVLRGERRSARG